MPGPGAVEEAIQAVRARIREAGVRAGRDLTRVTLVGATKTVPIETVRRAREAGLADFAENYASDLAEKASAVEARWHFVGKLQAGTASKVADHADVIHSAEPGRALRKVAGRAARAGRTIECLAQVDFTGSRQGVDPEDLAGFLVATARLDGVRVTGLMTLPPLSPDPEGARPYFARLRGLRDEVRRTWPHLEELSMGMSGDYEVAVEEGATMVRVGTALFGERSVTPGVTRRESSGGV
jgi:PLP dependent protein